MTETGLLEDDDLRFVDVLLREELTRDRSHALQEPTAPRPRRWLVAALLLVGMGVVVGVVATTATSPPTPAFEAPLQDPQPTPISNKNSALEDLYRQPTRAAVWAQVRKVRIERIRPGNLFEMLTLPGAEHILEQPADVQTFAQSFGAVLEGRQFPAGGSSFPLRTATMRVNLFLRDGRHVSAIIDPGEKPYLQFTHWDRFPIENAVFVARLRELQTKALSNPSITHGVVSRKSDLAVLPRTIRALTCPPLRGDELALVRRFGDLQALDINADDVRSPMGDLVFDAFAQLPGLRHVGFSTRGVTDEGLAQLAMLPKLESIELHGSFNHLSFETLEHLGPRLTALRLVGHQTSLQRLHQLSKWPLLRELWLTPENPEALAEVGRILARMPELRRLSVYCGSNIWDQDSSGSWDASQLLDRLAVTRIDKLKLTGVSAGAASWRALGKLPSLQQLDLRGLERCEADLLEELERFGHLARLDVRANDLDAQAAKRLQAALAKTHVLVDQASSLQLTSNSYLPPSWTTDR